MKKSRAGGEFIINIILNSCQILIGDLIGTFFCIFGVENISGFLCCHPRSSWKISTQ